MAFPSHSIVTEPDATCLISFPAHALLILEERLREQEAEGVKMPEGMERDELALQILIAAAGRSGGKS